MDEIKNHSNVMWIIVVVCLCAMIGALHTPSATAGETLTRVRAQHELRCGVTEKLLGFSFQDENGRWRGFNVDFCRAVAVAVLGDPGFRSHDVRCNFGRQRHPDRCLSQRGEHRYLCIPRQAGLIRNLHALRRTVHLMPVGDSSFVCFGHVLFCWPIENRCRHNVNSSERKAFYEKPVLCPRV